MSGTGLLEAGVYRRLLTDRPRSCSSLMSFNLHSRPPPPIRCARCYCNAHFLVCRSSFTHCSRPKCSNCSCRSHPVISITRCSQAKFDTCQEPTSRLHASQWKWRCRRLGRLMSRDVESTDSPTRVLSVGLLSAECHGRCFFALACIMKWKFAAAVAKFVRGRS